MTLPLLLSTDHFSIPIRVSKHVDDIFWRQFLTFFNLVGPVCLPSPGSKVIPNENLIGLGWGRTQDSRISKVLKENIFTTISDEECKRVYGSAIDGDVVLCTQDDPGQSVCQGDSGSSLGQIKSDGQFVLAGLISFTGTSCDKGYPAGYSEIEPLTDWIMQHSH